MIVTLHTCLQVIIIIKITIYSIIPEVKIMSRYPSAMHIDQITTHNSICVDIVSRQYYSSMHSSATNACGDAKIVIPTTC